MGNHADDEPFKRDAGRRFRHPWGGRGDSCWMEAPIQNAAGFNESQLEVRSRYGWSCAALIFRPLVRGVWNPQRTHRRRRERKHDNIDFHQNRKLSLVIRGHFEPRRQRKRPMASIGWELFHAVSLVRRGHESLKRD